jgi:NADPH:quinone reductase-like Zn-dependent oxidoreductase
MVGLQAGPGPGRDPRPRRRAQDQPLDRAAGHVAGVRLASLRASQKVVFFVARFTREDFLVLQELLEAGKVTPVIDRQYELSEAPAALSYLGEGHARAKVAITV